ncbi:MAG TPA: aconitate hydratase AcnA [Polyangiaceae bacterium]|jgi:aconitate hydratase|nr:aconitate hydratase AcnA [Polyangiaceae bacterium]
MADRCLDSFSTRSTLTIAGKTYSYFSLEKLAKSAGTDVGRLPFSLRILLENLLRCEDGQAVTKADVLGLASWDAKAEPDKEIAFHPARVILQDFTGVPAVVDLAAMRDAMAKMGGDPAKINPLFPSELVIDHSVQVDYFGTPEALGLNAKLEFERNVERYQLLRWGQKAFDNFKVVPPDQGIVHQVNLEYLARVVFDMEGVLYPDSLVGTDSHTTMINGIGVVGWGVGGIEAEAAMLGQPINLLVPQVIGFKLFGKLPSGSTATDLVLTVTRMLRDKGVVGKFVEFYGDGVGGLPLADRATIANMSPEFGSTIGIFPIDAETINYLNATGRGERAVVVEAYAKAQGLFREMGARDPEFTDTLTLDLSTVVPTLAGPRRPHDKVLLSDMKATWKKALPELITAAKGDPKDLEKKVSITLDGAPTEIGHGSVVIAAITSCTNTSNPSVLIAAGLLAKKAVEKGLTTKPWVKSSLAPGSKVVTQYLGKAGVLTALEALKFNVVGYGCTTCIGNSGPLPDAVAGGITQANLVACAVLSGNRNFEGRINPHVRGNYLASPPLVVAYALAGKVDIDFEKEPLGKGKDGKDVFLKDVWPSAEEVATTLGGALSPAMFESEYKGVFEGDESWQTLSVPEGNRFGWDPASTYIRKPTFFDDVALEPAPRTDIHGARVLLALGDSVTTDHISPAGNIAKDSAAARYLVEHGVKPVDFNSYGARRGNHEVMVRGTFANTRLRNALAQGKEGSWTRHLPDGEVVSVYDASVKYQAAGVPLVVLAGKEYGSGSSRDWAAKGTYMLGVRAVIAQSYERIHRSNLIGMGILPLQFESGASWESLGLTGEETFDVDGIAANLAPGKHITVSAKSANGQAKQFAVLTRIDTVVELEYYRHGGILQYVLRQLLKA